MLQFNKYHGTGNDFILIDGRRISHSFQQSEIKLLCDRHLGIGADGLILLTNEEGVDFKMLYYNSDGLAGSMCGNGGRCAVAFAHSLGIIKDKAVFNAFDGSHRAELLSVNPYHVRLQMQDVLSVDEHTFNFILNTGSPHYCVFVDNCNSIDVLAEGRKIRYSPAFQERGINVNFIEVSSGELLVRTYERGVEAETLSCGTGVTAAVLAAAFSGKINGNSCKVITPGGKLKVEFAREKNTFINIGLEGPAVEVFHGEI